MPRISINISAAEAAKLKSKTGEGNTSSALAKLFNSSLSSGLKRTKKAKPPRAAKKASKAPAARKAAPKKKGGAKLTKAAFLARMAAGRAKAAKAKKRAQK